MENNEVKRIANILFNMSLGMDYDTFADDYKDEMENKLVNADGSICR